jgi:hypothetical protein
MSKFFGSEIFISIVTEWVMTILLSELLLAIVLALWLRNKILKVKNLASTATPLGVGFGILVLASLLVVYDRYEGIAVKTVQDELQKKKADDEKQKMDERASPEYLQSKIRSWLDRAGYPSQTDNKPADREQFKINATVNGLQFIITQDKGTPGILKLTHGMVAMPEFEEKLKKLSGLERLGFMKEIELELLRIGIQHAITLGQNNWIVVQHEFPVDTEKGGVDFAYKIFVLKRARRLIQIHSDELLGRILEKKTSYR